jgi:hypothetical protein
MAKSGSDEFPSVNEMAALQDDIQELEERVRAARTATEILAGELSAVQTENLEAWSQVLREREQQIMDQYAAIEQRMQAVLDLWRQHASLVETITGERQYPDFAHPSRPIMLKDLGDVVISSLR